MIAALVAHGLVDASGQLRLDARSSFAQDVKRFAGKRIVLRVEEEQDVRTLAANARFWKLCELAAEAMSHGRELPISKDEAKLALCRAFLGVTETPFGPVPKGTRHLTPAEMSRLQADIEGHYASIGQRLPMDGVA